MDNFDTVDEMWIAAAQDILTNGATLESRDGGSKEILGYAARLNNPLANFMFNPIRKMHPSYAAGEMIWYLSGEERIDAIVPYAPQYDRFAEDGMDPRGEPEDVVRIARGAYGHRWRYAEKYNQVHQEFDQLERLIELLHEKPNTRQAVVTMYHPFDLQRAERSKDIPCTLALNFIVRDGKLNLIATMRSNDHWLGFPYDVFCFTTLQQLIAMQLGIPVGWYQHQAMSLHAYDRNLQKFIEAANPPVFTAGGMDYVPPRFPRKLHEIVKSLVTQEYWDRSNQVAANQIEDEHGEGTLCSELLLMAAVKWDFTQDTYKRIKNKLMKEYCKDFFSKVKEK